jgi:hypothetical protein
MQMFHDHGMAAAYRKPAPCGTAEPGLHATHMLDRPGLD